MQGLNFLRVFFWGLCALLLGSASSYGQQQHWHQRQHVPLRQRQHVPQHQRQCGHQVLLYNLMQQDGFYDRWENTRMRLKRWEVSRSGQVRVDSVIQPALYRIPVVVHILFPPDSLYGRGGHLTLEQVRSNIDVLNEDFRRILGSRGYNQHPVGSDARIEFCLATRDPSGAPSQGIVYVPYSGSAAHSMGNDRAMKDASRWPTDRYLNIWVVQNISGALGYSFLAEWMDGNPERSFVDGVVVSARYMGSRDKQAGQAFWLDDTYELGRTLTHEVGHYLNLWHIWGDANDCSGDDYVDDTPPCSGSFFGCPPNPSRPVQCGFPRQTENYMDYTDDPCMSVFSVGQSTRMHNALNFFAFRRLLWDPLNLISTGCGDQEFLAADSLILERDTVELNSLLMPADESPVVRVVNASFQGLHQHPVDFAIDVRPLGSMLSYQNPGIPTRFDGRAASGRLAFDVPGIYRMRITSQTRKGPPHVDAFVRVKASATVYPNPFSNELVVGLDLDAPQQVIWQLYNTIGQLLAEEQVYTQSAIRIPSFPYPASAYYLRVNWASQSQTFRLVKTP